MAKAWPKQFPTLRKAQATPEFSVNELYAAMQVQATWRGFVSRRKFVRSLAAAKADNRLQNAREIDDLTLPSLVFIGDQEQYQRRRVIETSVKVMQDKGREARLIIYPGVGRGFDFRPENVRTFADDLASKDAVMRAASFMRKHLEKYKN